MQIICYFNIFNIIVLFLAYRCFNGKKLHTRAGG